MHSSAALSALALRLTSGKIATLPVSGQGMYRPFISKITVTSAQRSPAQVNFSIDVRDYDADLATASSTSVSAVAVTVFTADIGDSGNITLNGTSMVGLQNGTLSGSFQPRVNNIPSGFTATLYVYVFDALGNQSNIITIPAKFP